jgi:hypothetical protein
MESGAGPTQKAEPLSVLLDDIPQRLANQAVLFEVVMFSDKFVPAIFFLTAIDQLNRDCLGCVFPEDFTDNILRF